MSTHPEETETKGNTVSILEATRGVWEVEGTVAPAPQRGIRRILSKDPLTPFDIDGKMPISLGLTCSSKWKILKMPLNAGRRG